MAAACDKTPSAGNLEQDILSLTESVQGRFAVVFHDLSDPENKVEIRAREMFHAASTMKTPVLYTLWNMERNGEISWDDSVDVKNEFLSIVDGSPYQMEISRDGGEGLYNAIGSKRTVRELAHDMITVSSNLATNILIAYADAKRVTADMRALGADSIQVLRGVEDLKAFDAGLNNRTSALDLAVLFHEIYRLGDAAVVMKDILLAQKFRDIIAGGVPEDVVVASKSGGITNTVHDSGIVYLPDGRAYIVVFMSDGLDGNESGNQLGARISETIYHFMTTR